MEAENVPADPARLVKEVDAERRNTANEVVQRLAERFPPDVEGRAAAHHLGEDARKPDDEIVQTAQTSNASTQRILGSVHGNCVQESPPF